MSDLFGTPDCWFSQANAQIYFRSGSIGYGKPPADSISTVVIIIISVGLGLPVVIILLGGIYVCAKKKDPKPVKPLRNVQDEYQPIPNGQVDS